MSTRLASSGATLLHPFPIPRSSCTWLAGSFPLTPPCPLPGRRQMDSSGKEWWVTNNTYWKLRAEPGYGNLDGAVLW